jgi:hypothetical protein
LYFSNDPLFIAGVVPNLRGILKTWRWTAHVVGWLLQISVVPRKQYVLYAPSSIK